MKYYLLLLLLAILAFSACNKNPLKPDDARQLLAGYYNANPNELIGNTAFEAVIRGNDSGSNNIIFRKYIPAGLLQLKQTKTNENGIPVYIFEVTNTGKPYLIKEILSKEGYPTFVVKIYDYYVDKIADIKYSPDKKEAAAYFNLSIRNLTPFGKNVADPNHKLYLIGIFKSDKNTWKFERIEIDVDRVWDKL